MLPLATRSSLNAIESARGAVAVPRRAPSIGVEEEPFSAVAPQERLFSSPLGAFSSPLGVFSSPPGAFSSPPGAGLVAPQERLVAPQSV